jgi:hypothetical protein
MASGVTPMSGFKASPTGSDAKRSLKPACHRTPGVLLISSKSLVANIVLAVRVFG